MSGIVELDQLLKSLSPELQSGEFAFCTVGGSIADYVHLEPLACFSEREGLTLIVLAETAEQAGLAFEGRFRQITLTVHSSLNAVGLTAAVAAKLSSQGVSANVVAAFYHDHVFVAEDLAERALAALRMLAEEARS